MITDRWLARLFGVAICTYGAVLIGTLCWQIIKGYETDKNAHDLTYLIIGLVGGQITTHGGKENKDGTQDISVPDPLPAPAAAPAPAAPAPAAPPADAMPDPDGADPGVLDPAP